MAQRKPISKKMRFEIFKRDNFTCAYCGETPPKAVLNVDHIHPVSKGGTNDEDNLITACFNCNIGKGANMLDVAPQTIEEKRKDLAEKEEQLAAYQKLKRSIARRQNKQIKEIESYFTDVFEVEFKQKFKNSIRINFLPHLDQDELLNAASIACDKTHTPNDATRYFCGICWNKIKAQ